jgi:hypothetical protein
MPFYAAFRRSLVLFALLTVAGCRFDESALAPTAPDVPLERLTISCSRPANAVVCEALAHYADGTVQTVTAQASWSSSDLTIANIVRGVITSTRGGTLEIAAGYLGVTGRLQLTVPPAL